MEITTSNRFQVLIEDDLLVDQILSPEDVLSQDETQPPEETFFSEERSFYNFMIKNNKCTTNNNNYFMYERNKNFCSGYFPDFITLDDEFYYHLSNNINHNYYYLKVKNNKYLKYLSNNSSKYNNEYFDNLKLEYKISNKNSNKLVVTNDNYDLKKKKNLGLISVQDHPKYLR